MLFHDSIFFLKYYRLKRLFPEQFRYESNSHHYYAAGKQYPERDGKKNQNRMLTLFQDASQTCVCGGDCRRHTRINQNRVNRAVDNIGEIGVSCQPGEICSRRHKARGADKKTEGAFAQAGFREENNFHFPQLLTNTGSLFMVKAVSYISR